MQIVITADDFGHSADTVATTVDCFARGALTSASQMVNMPASGAAFDFAKANAQFSFGVHLTYVADSIEAPLSALDRIPALVTSQGVFKPSNEVRRDALAGRIPVEQIAIETEAQLGRMRDSGIAISHVDSHGHLHKFAPFREALARVLPRFGVRRVRSVQDVYCAIPWRSPTFWLGPFWRTAIRKRFVTTDHFFMDPGSDDSWPERLLRHARRGTLEVGVHPGHEDEWRRSETARVVRFAKIARDQGHALIGWSEVAMPDA